MRFLVRFKLSILLALILLSSFVIISIVVKLEKLDKFDQWLLSNIHKNHSSFLTKVMKFLDFIGSTYFIIGVSLLLLFYLYFMMKDRLMSVLFIVTMLGERLLGEGLKPLLRRSRPNGQHLIEVDGHSFPSQHAMNTFVLYGFLLFILWRHVKNKKMKVLLTLIVITIILVMGLSRIYLGVHHPSDVIGGYLISGFWLTMVILYARYYEEKNKLRDS
ncbi:phosphatase PAP2 family protein [Priestia megaterium]|nr:phosphatase PAP2 family protein [Priestia megaterium]MCT9852374.1 phosphatase PAP2 family protein [Priestia megaterium]MDF1964247.1 phosphatase PAP2 family protein [Priestia megaterium]